jgi:hypothetical protein
VAGQDTHVHSSHMLPQAPGPQPSWSRQLIEKELQEQLQAQAAPPQRTQHSHTATRGPPRSSQPLQQCNCHYNSRPAVLLVHALQRLVPPADVADGLRPLAAVQAGAHDAEAVGGVQAARSHAHLRRRMSRDQTRVLQFGDSTHHVHGRWQGFPGAVLLPAAQLLDPNRCS